MGKGWVNVDTGIVIKGLHSSAYNVAYRVDLRLIN